MSLRNIYVMFKHLIPYSKKSTKVTIFLQICSYILRGIVECITNGLTVSLLRQSCLKLRQNLDSLETAFNFVNTTELYVSQTAGLVIQREFENVIRLTTNTKCSVSFCTSLLREIMWNSTTLQGYILKDHSISLCKPTFAR